MSEQGDQEKTDPASEHKLKRAREQGQAPKSQDVTLAALLVAMAALVFGMGNDSVLDISRTLQTSLININNVSGDPVLMLTMLQKMIFALAPAMAMPLLIVMIVAVLAGLAQVGFTLSTEPIAPDFSRINPAQGLERLFSMRSMYDAVRSALKVAVVGTVAWMHGAPLLKELITLPYVSAPALLDYLIHRVGVILAILAVLFIAIAALDHGYTKWEFLKKMRMSKREVKDEHKQREGDPRIKSRLRELRMEWLKKSLSAQKVKDADVLITNPTQIAVAIAYRRESMAAPQILTMGAGGQAKKMRLLAQRHKVLIVENRPLARALYAEVGPGEALPEKHYAAVARILAWVLAQKNANTGRAQAQK